MAHTVMWWLIGLGDVVAHWRCGGSFRDVVAHWFWRCGGSFAGYVVIHWLEMWWLIGSAPDFWGRGSGIESTIILMCCWIIV